MFHQIRPLLVKDLRREWRTREILTTTVAFAVLLMAIFAFSFFQTQETVILVFPGILWVSILFAGTLTVSRIFVQEKDSGCLRALALIPGTHHSLYIAKLMVTWAFMTGFEAFMIPIMILAFDVPVGSVWGPFILCVLLGTLGFSALGTLLAAMLVHHRLREVMLPLVLYPLMIPLLISGVKATSLLLVRGATPEMWEWLAISAAIDVTFLILSQLLFRSVLQAIE